MNVPPKEKGAAVSAAAEGNQLTIAREDQAATVSAEEEATAVSAGCNAGEGSNIECCSRGYSTDNSS